MQDSSDKTYTISLNSKDPSGFSHVAISQISDKLKNLISESNSNYVLIDFYTTWCGPCKQLTPELETCQETLKKDNINLKCIKIDITNDASIISGISIQSVPYCILAKKDENGAEFINHFMGFKQSDDIVEFVKESI